MRRRLVWPLLVLLIVVAVLGGLYLYGRYGTCPPPDWWVTLFVRSGKFGCVAR
jgi:hypothetical protein